MNVLCLTEYFPHNKNLYAGVAVHSLCRELTQHANVDIYNFFPLFPTFKGWSVSRLSRRDAPFKESVDGINIIRPGYWNIPKMGKLFAPELFVRKLINSELFNRRRYDLIHANWIFRAGYVGSLLSRSLHIPLIITCHGSDIHVDLHKKGLTGRLSGVALKSSHALIAVSQELKDCIIAEGIPAEKISVIPNGVDLCTFYSRNKLDARRELNLPDSKFIFVYIGNYFYIKGPDVLLEAVKRIQASATDFLLLLVGQGIMRSELAEFAKRSGIESKIKFVPPQPHNLVAKWLAASDALVLPSRNEGCPMILLEALASGRPVIGTNVGAVSELISSDQLGKVVIPENPTELAGALEWAMKQKWNAELISSRMQEWGWENRAKQVMEVYAKVIGEGKNESQV